jgi:hypothetical protein
MTKGGKERFILDLLITSILGIVIVNLTDIQTFVSCVLVGLGCSLAVLIYRMCTKGTAWLYWE